MVTGDNLKTAKAIALECGILDSESEAVDSESEAIIEGSAFRSLSQVQREQKAEQISVCKIRFIQNLRKGIGKTNCHVNDCNMMEISAHTILYTSLHCCCYIMWLHPLQISGWAFTGESVKMNLFKYVVEKCYGCELLTSHAICHVGSYLYDNLLKYLSEEDKIHVWSWFSSQHAYLDMYTCIRYVLWSWF